MPLEISNADSHAEVVIRGTGFVTGPEILNVLESLYSSGVLSDQLWDLTEVERADASVAELRRMAAMDRAALAENPELRVVIAASKDLAFGLARMWQALVATITRRPQSGRERQFGVDPTRGPTWYWRQVLAIWASSQRHERHLTSANALSRVVSKRNFTSIHVRIRTGLTTSTFSMVFARPAGRTEIYPIGRG